MMIEQIFILLFLLTIPVCGLFLFFNYRAKDTEIRRRARISALVGAGPFALFFLGAILTYDGTCTWKTPEPCGFIEYLFFPLGAMGLYTIPAIIWMGLFLTVWSLIVLVPKLIKVTRPVSENPHNR